MPEEAFHGKNKPLTSDKLPDKIEDAINSEGKSVRVPVSDATRKDLKQDIDRINAALNRPGIPESAKAHLRQKKQRLTNGIVGFSIEDAQNLLQQLQRFQEIVGDDWRSVLTQWQNLQGCWQDPQYDRFEPFFEALCRTYAECERQCEDYAQFLEARIRGAEDATATLNM